MRLTHMLIHIRQIPPMYCCELRRGLSVFCLLFETNSCINAFFCVLELPSAWFIFVTLLNIDRLNSLLQIFFLRVDCPACVLSELIMEPQTIYVYPNCIERKKKSQLVFHRDMQCMQTFYNFDC